MAGALPAPSSIKTVAKRGQIACDSELENVKRDCGKVVDLMLEVLGGDYAGVVDGLIRPGYPTRIDSYSYHVKQDPTRLDCEWAGAS